MAPPPKTVSARSWLLAAVLAASACAPSPVTRRAQTPPEQASVDEPPEEQAKPFSQDDLPEHALRRYGSARFRHYGLEVLSFIERGKRLFGGHYNGVTLWALDGEPLATRDGDSDLAVAADTGQYAVGDYRTVRILDARKGSELGSFDATETIEALAFSHDGKHVATIDDEGVVATYDAASGKVLMRSTERQKYYDPEIAFDPSGTRVVLAYAARLRIWKLSDPDHIADVDLDDKVKGFAFSADGTRIIAASYLGAEMHSLAGGEPKKFRKGRRSYPIAVSSRGLIAIGSGDGDVSFFDKDLKNAGRWQAVAPTSSAWRSIPPVGAWRRASIRAPSRCGMCSGAKTSRRAVPTRRRSTTSPSRATANGWPRRATMGWCACGGVTTARSCIVCRPAAVARRPWCSRPTTRPSHSPIATAGW